MTTPVPPVPAPGPAVPGAPATPAAPPDGRPLFEQMFSVVKAQFPTARMTSGYRPGDPGYHGKKQACDIAGPSSGDAPFMMQVNKWLATTHPTSTQIIHTPGINIFEGQPHTYNASTQAAHHDHVHWALKDASLLGPVPAGGAAPAAAGGAAAGGAAAVPPFGYGLFNTMFTSNAYLDNVAQGLIGNKALINDVQLMTMIQAVCKAGLRSFQSAPDGQFVAYYPDYFGIHNNAATFKLEDIEMKNVSIQYSDGPLATHVYTVGDSYTNFGTAMTENRELAWHTTQGVITIEDEDVMKMVLNIDPKKEEDFKPEAIYKRFGARPLVMNMPMVKDPVMERFQALHMFIQQWAKQYSTRIETTFLPEVFPGMRIELSGHSLTVYVTQVTHTIDRKMGFKTELVIMAPSTTDGKLKGLPVSNSNAPDKPVSEAPAVSGEDDESVDSETIR